MKVKRMKMRKRRYEHINWIKDLSINRNKVKGWMVSIFCKVSSLSMREDSSTNTVEVWKHLACKRNWTNKVQSSNTNLSKRSKKVYHTITSKLYPTKDPYIRKLTRITKSIIQYQTYKNNTLLFCNP